jgi:hypothetical protein
MLYPEALQSYTRAEPFRPFIITMMTGRTYEIRHPEMIRVMRDYFVFFHTSPADEDYNRFETVSLLQVDRINAIEQTAPPATNN